MNTASIAAASRGDGMTRSGNLASSPIRRDINDAPPLRRPAFSGGSDSAFSVPPTVSRVERLFD